MTFSPMEMMMILQEGEEPDAFWSALGGKGEYADEVDLNKPILEPRLFHCRRVGEKLRAVEVNNFQQEVNNNNGEM